MYPVNLLHRIIAQQMVVLINFGDFGFIVYACMRIFSISFETLLICLFKKEDEAYVARAEYVYNK